MAYSDDISNLGADHHWKFDGDSTDAIGSANGVDTTMTHTASNIAADATVCASMDQRTDKVVLPTTTTIENSANARKAMAGWYRLTDIELPMCVIYTEGIYSNNFQFMSMPGNSVIFEVRNGANFAVQVYSDIALAKDRTYHFCGIFEGSGYGNEARFYIDGVEQLQADPTDREPDYATMAARTQVGIFGNPVATHTDVGIGGADYADDIQSPGDNRSTEQIITAYYQHWCAWGDGTDAVLTDTEVRETLFERGALAENTISTNTEANMQTALDLLGNQSDAALNIEIEAVTGGGNFTLDLDGQDFDDLASMHVRYNGTSDTLTIRNTNGANADPAKCGAPFGGTIEVFTETTVQVTVKDASDESVIEGARVLLEADGTSGPLADGVDIINANTNASGVTSVTFDYSADQPVRGKVRKGSASTYYKATTFTDNITSNGLDVTILIVKDE